MSPLSQVLSPYVRPRSRFRRPKSSPVTREPAQLTPAHSHTEALSAAVQPSGTSRESQPSGQSAVPSVPASTSQVGVWAAVSVQPEGQAADPSVPASRSQAGVEAAVFVQPAGQASELSVAASRSHALPSSDVGRLRAQS